MYYLYRYRWFYTITIFIFSMLTGVLSDSYPLLKQLMALMKDEELLCEKLTMEKSSVQMSQSKEPSILSYEKNQAVKIHDLIVLAQMKGLLMKTINLTHQKDGRSDNTWNLHLVASGDFMQLAAFIWAIENESFPASIHDFSCKLISQDNMRFSLDILLMSDPISLSTMDENQGVLLKLHNPFCLPQDSRSHVNENGLSSLRSVQIKQIKMVGYLHQQEHVQALVLLPSGTVVLIKQGSIIGKESGVVDRISRDRIRIQLQGGKDVVLKMFTSN
ncbi:MAG: pilus assembly protein PilP [Gammaproteobacteria bacterium]|nr:pilus assembly protein PilP [Gammaproteobacteria bacterium]MCW5583677.1 pilus assembly protein PilP [Gammaproteobacteria bacterium]